MARHLALIEHDVARRIDARGDEGCRHLARVAAELVGVLEHGDGVEVDHAIEAVMLGLERHEARDGAEIIAEMQIAGRLHAREDAGLGLGLLHRLALLVPAGYGVAQGRAQAFAQRSDAAGAWRRRRDLKPLRFLLPDRRDSSATFFPASTCRCSCRGSWCNSCTRRGTLAGNPVLSVQWLLL